MGKKRSLCHYTKQPKEQKRKTSKRLVVEWNADRFIEQMYNDNKRLIEENAILRERARAIWNKEQAIDVDLINEEEK